MVVGVRSNRDGVLTDGEAGGAGLAGVHLDGDRWTVASATAAPFHEMPVGGSGSGKCDPGLISLVVAMADACVAACAGQARISGVMNGMRWIL